MYRFIFSGVMHGVTGRVLVAFGLFERRINVFSDWVVDPAKVEAP